MLFNETTGEMQVNACAAGEICPFVFSGNSTCESVGELEVYPGDYCANNANCTTGICESGMCVNLQEPNCTNVYDCSPGLYCNISSLECEPQRSEGQSCYFEYDCENDLTCIMGVCVQYFSLDLGAQVDYVEDRNTGLTLACATGFSEYSNKFNTNVCAPVIKSATFPAQCQPDSMCFDSTGIFKTPCICGYGNSGYCPPFPGDPPIQQFMQNFTQIITLNSACNTFSRFRFTCFGQSSPYVRNLFNEFQVVYAQIMEGIYPLTENVQSCVADALLSDYVAKQEAANTPVVRECVPYDCEFHEEMKGINQCVFYEIDVGEFQYSNPRIHLAPCLNNETDTCSLVPASNSTCEPLATTRYPGDYCETHMDCVSSDCASGMCQGNMFNTTCESIYDCNPGSYCNFTYMVCAIQKQIGEECLSEFECENHLGCNMGICTPYFSIPDGSFTDMAEEDGFATLCASGYAYMGQCQAPPTSNATPPANCDINKDCTSSIAGVSKPCLCGYNPTGESYCPLFIGDPIPQKGIANMKKLISYNHICNTFSRFNEGCFLRNIASLGTYYSYASAMLNYTMYAEVQEPAVCINVTLGRSIQETAMKATQYSAPQPKPDIDEGGSSGEVLGLVGTMLLWTSL